MYDFEIQTGTLTNILGLLLFQEDTGEYEDDDDDNEDTPGHSKRRKIRKVMANKKLADSTKEARKAEEERRKRIDERQKEVWIIDLDFMKLELSQKFPTYNKSTIDYTETILLTSL